MRRALTLSLVTLLLSVLALVGAEFASPLKIVDLKIDQDLAMLKMMREMVDSDVLASGSLPSEETLSMLFVSESTSRGAHFPKDTWGRAYIYRVISGSPGYIIYSAGRNGIDEQGGGDDITTGDKIYSCEEYGKGCPREISYIVRLIALLSMAVSLCVFVICLAIAIFQRFRFRRDE